MANLLPSLSDVFVVIAKKSYTPLINDDDELLIGNWGALRLGLDALTKEDAQDFERAAQLWDAAKKLLVNEEENLVGAGAEGPLQMQDDFEMERLAFGL